MKSFKQFVIELNKKTLGSYVKKASDNQNLNHHVSGNFAYPVKDRQVAIRRLDTRKAGIHRAADKLAKEEVVVENLRNHVTVGGVHYGTIRSAQHAHFLHKHVNGGLHDYYHPFSGEKRQGYITHIGKNHYRVQDVKDKSKHKFLYNPEA